MEAGSPHWKRKSVVSAPGTGRKSQGTGYSGHQDMADWDSGVVKEVQRTDRYQDEDQQKSWRPCQMRIFLKEFVTTTFQFLHGLWDEREVRVRCC